MNNVELIFENPLWKKLLNACGMDENGIYCGKLGDEYRGRNNGFKNKTFEIMPYIWDVEDGDEDVLQLPNFVYYPEDIKVYWHKYPFRKAECNKELNVEDVTRILGKCYDSVRILKSVSWKLGEKGEIYPGDEVKVFDIRDGKNKKGKVIGVTKSLEIIELENWLLEITELKIRLKEDENIYRAIWFKNFDGKECWCIIE